MPQLVPNPGRFPVETVGNLCRVDDSGGGDLGRRKPHPPSSSFGLVSRLPQRDDTARLGVISSKATGREFAKAQEGEEYISRFTCRTALFGWAASSSVRDQHRRTTCARAV